MRKLTLEDIIMLRSEELGHIRHIDRLNYQSVTSISTVTIGVITIISAIPGNIEIFSYLIVLLVAINLIGVQILVSYRKIYLEKHDMIRTLEKILPTDLILPQRWSKRLKGFPIFGYFSAMIYIHIIMILVIWIWGLAHLHFIFNFIVLFCIFIVPVGAIIIIIIWIIYLYTWSKNR